MCGEPKYCRQFGLIVMRNSYSRSYRIVGGHGPDHEKQNDQRNLNGPQVCRECDAEVAKHAEYLWLPDFKAIDGTLFRQRILSVNTPGNIPKR